MRFWFDTEFIDDGRTVDLISIGIVAEDGRTYYAISDAFDPERADAWVRRNVLAKLPPRDDPAWRARRTIADEVEAFVGRSEVEFWAYYPSYDWVCLSQLYGPLVRRPESWPKRCRDVAELAAYVGDVERPPEPANAHDALVDARWAKAYWDACVAKLGRLP